MKKAFLTFSMILSGWVLFAQTTPVQNPNTGTNVNTTDANSNSGVNPNGNPGTIINNTTNSTTANTMLDSTRAATTITDPQLNSTQVTTDAPPAPSNQAVIQHNMSNSTTNPNGLTANPAAAGVNPNKVDVNTTTTPATGTVTTQATGTVTPASGTVTTTTAVTTTSDSIPEGTQISNNNVTAYAGANPIMYSSTNIRTTNADGSPRAIGLQKFAAIPVLNTYVPQEAVNEIFNRFGDSAYDITMIKTAPDQYAYSVRVEENGVYRTELVNANMQ